MEHPTYINKLGLKNLATFLRENDETVAAQLIDQEDERAIESWSHEATSDAYFHDGKLYNCYVELKSKSVGGLTRETATYTFDSSEITSIEEE